MEEQDIGAPTLLRLFVTPPLPKSPSPVRSSAGGIAATATAAAFDASSSGADRAAWHVQWLALNTLAADGSCQGTKYFWVDRCVDWVAATCSSQIQNFH
jgi:hypothetical protein